ncbi:Stage V sporulation protein D [compost metagenome]
MNGVVPGRFPAFVTVAALAASVIGFRLVNLQVFSGEQYLERAEGNRLRINLLAAPRGQIRDRNGQILASSRLSYQIALHPVQLNKEQRVEVADRLATILGLPAEELRAKLQRKGPSALPIPMLQDVDESVIARVAEHQRELPGVSIDPVVVRHYPRGAFAAHAIGYTGEVTERELSKMEDEGYRAGDIIGKMGIEKVFDSHLRGVPGRQQVEVDARGRPMRKLAEVPPVPGKDITLTIDVKLQAAAEQALGDRKGSVVVLEPFSGEVLALASNPDFDPNVFATRLTPKAWREINSPSRPLLNRAIQSVYPPGSIYKIVTHAAAMEGGYANWNSRYVSTGQFYVGSKLFRDWKPGGWGRVEFKEGLVKSIDTIYYELGLKMGPDRMKRYSHMFGLGEKTGIILPSEREGLIPDGAWKKKALKEKWYPGDSVNMSIGQGYIQTSPIQAAVEIATVANSGKVMRPVLVRSPEGLDPVEVRKTVELKPETWRMLHTALAETVSRGTAAAARIPGYPAAGKTGSAEAIKGKPTHAWFVAYAPTDKPTIAVAVMLEMAGGGGSVAGPVAGHLLRTHFGVPDPNAKPASGSATPSIPAVPVDGD